MTRPRVALVMFAVGDLSGSGGAEREFSDLFEYLCRSNPGMASLITDRSSMARLRQAGRLTGMEPVIGLPLGSRPAAGKVSVAWLTFLLFCVTMWHRFDVVHLCLPTPTYVPYAAMVGWLPRSVRPGIVLTVIDCTLAANLVSGRAADRYEQQVVDAHRLYFRWARLDGVYSWYQAFVEVARRLSLVPASTKMAAARFCSTDPSRFKPGVKERLIVFAGRLSEQKRPLLLVDAIAALRTTAPRALDGWRVEMYGKGPLEADVRARIVNHGLADILSLTHAIDMAPVFARSRLFVSTQAFENFTSLAMLEAMASGNAVIAEDVGQTREFVRPGDNGLVVTPATAEAFADAIARYLAAPEQHDAMAAASRRLTTDVHTIEKFAGDITAFWAEVCG